MTFDIPYRLVQESPKRISLRFPPFWRVISGLVAALVIAVALSAGSVHAIGVAIAAIGALGALYDERWVFDAEAGSFSFTAGIGPLRRRRQWEVADVATVTVSAPPAAEDDHSRRASRLLLGRSGHAGPQHLTTLGLDLTDEATDRTGEPRVRIESVSPRLHSTAVEKARRISRLLSVALDDGSHDGAS